MTDHRINEPGSNGHGSGLEGAVEEARRDAELSRRRLAEVQSLTNVGSWEWELTSQRADWSPELRQIAGLAPGEPVPTFEEFVDSIHPEDRVGFLDNLRTALDSGGVRHYTYRALLPDGTVKLIESHARVETDAAGRPVRIIGAAQDVTEQTAELRSVVEELERSRRETIHRLSMAVETRDVETGGHIGRIGELAALIGERLSLDEERVDLLRIASPMHDVGKIGISDHILRKPDRLTADERTEMERHTEIGFRILSGAESEPLDLAADIALTHHEKMDGSGYPQGLVGTEIPLEGRIAAVVDVFDALISDRVYRPAYEVEDAMAIMQEGRGSHFDPEPLDALLSDAETLLQVRASV